ncbi:tail fiber protein [Salmonella phage 36]|uniref:Uncharacterized protein n=1 Tax=Salmonella phage 36 TaxID=1654889 RepID=A0A0N7CGB3_9CAUD|nr:tail fiber protein [Salmonella phage 36]AKJ74032.1 hypothetical protein SP36_60 [Salmonella phage 36]
MQPENLLHKDQNLNDVSDKGAARIALFLDRFNQFEGETTIQSPDKIKYLTVGNASWGFWDTSAQNFIPLGVQQVVAVQITLPKQELTFRLTDWCNKITERLSVETIVVMVYSSRMQQNGE